MRARTGCTWLIWTAGAVITVPVALLLLATAPTQEDERVGCVGNLRRLGVALKLYKQDHGAYPADSTERPPTAYWYGSSETAGDGVGLARLFPDYLEHQSMFHCPCNWIDGPRAQAYASYSLPDPAKVGADRVKYRRVWRRMAAGPDRRERRQLIWPHPAEDTVVTWCHLHRRRPKSAAVRESDWDLVLLVDLSVHQVLSSRSGHGWCPKPASQ